MRPVGAQGGPLSPRSPTMLRGFLEARQALRAHRVLIHRHRPGEIHLRGEGGWDSQAWKENAYYQGSKWDRFLDRPARAAPNTVENSKLLTISRSSAPIGAPHEPRCAAAARSASAPRSSTRTKSRAARCSTYARAAGGRARVTGSTVCLCLTRFAASRLVPSRKLAPMPIATATKIQE